MKNRRLDSIGTAIKDARRRFKALWGDEDGLTALEYALLLMLMALSALVAWRSMGDVVAASTEDSTSQVGSATTMACTSTGITLRPMH